jgi:NDP-sugar pyrophosphorylase family protein
MKAMVFAAGLGTRLKPFTESMPKAMVPIAGKPMIGWLLRHLQENGVGEFIVNVHHFAEQIFLFLESEACKDLKISISHEKDALLDTGGGLRYAAWFFNDRQPFLVHNVDIISDVNIHQMLRAHKKQKALATLAVTERKSFRYLLFDAEMHLSGWGDHRSGEEILVKKSNQTLKEFSFSGIHIIDPQIFQYMPAGGKFSIIQTYLDLAKDFIISGFTHDPLNWLDLGNAYNLRDAEILLKKLGRV